MKQEEFDELKILLLKRVGGLVLKVEPVEMSSAKTNLQSISYYSQIEVFEDIEEEVMTFVCHTNPDINGSVESKELVYQAKLRGNIAKYLGVVEGKSTYNDSRELLESIENKIVNDTLLVLRDTLITANAFSI